MNAFTGAAAFVATAGPSARRDAHAFADNTPITSPDEGGNFYAPAAFPFPANAGVRSAAASRVMNGPPPQGNGNGGQCHGGGTQQWIHLP